MTSWKVSGRDASALQLVVSVVVTSVLDVRGLVVQILGSRRRKVVGQVCANMSRLPTASLLLHLKTEPCAQRRSNTKEGIGPRSSLRRDVDLQHPPPPISSV